MSGSVIHGKDRLKFIGLSCKIESAKEMRGKSAKLSDILMQIVRV